LTGECGGLEDPWVDADAVNVVVSAIGAGAAAGLKASASKVVTDAYAGLKKLVTDRYAHVDVSAVENKPESVAKRDSLAEDLQDAGAGSDEELVTAAQRVLAAVAEHAPKVGSVIGVDVVGLSAVNVRLSDIRVEGPNAVGLRARDVIVSGDFEVRRIRATGEAGGPPDPPAR